MGERHHGVVSDGSACSDGDGTGQKFMERVYDKPYGQLLWDKEEDVLCQARSTCVQLQLVFVLNGEFCFTHHQRSRHTDNLRIYRLVHAKSFAIGGDDMAWMKRLTSVVNRY